MSKNGTGVEEEVKDQSRDAYYMVNGEPRGYFRLLAFDGYHGFTDVHWKGYYMTVHEALQKVEGYEDITKWETIHVEPRNCALHGRIGWGVTCFSLAQSTTIGPKQDLKCIQIGVRRGKTPFFPSSLKKKKDKL